MTACLLLAAVPAKALADPARTALRVYGPGGPHEVLSKCAVLYRQLHGEEVVVLRNGPVTMGQTVAHDGDLFFGGAEFMLEDFVRSNPGVLDLESVDKLRPRRIGIIVRRGNPLGIRGPEDLRREGMRVIGARLEKVSGFLGQPADPNVSNHPPVLTGGDALKAWRADPTIDAWITYRSWHVVLAAEADFIEIPDESALRFTPIAITASTPRREAAERFIAFLKTPEALRVFREHGWD